MKAFILESYGANRALQLADVPEPHLRDDEVLVQVHAAGVNQLDSKIRDGQFKLILPYRLPLILGHDVAGVVVKAGPRVRQFKPGDEVYARTDDFRIGTFAEFVPVRESSLAPKPKGLTMEEAASIPLVGLTAWQVLVETARLARGRRSSSRPAPAAWARSPSSWPGTWAPLWPPRRARPTSIWSGAWARMSSSTTARRTSRMSCTTTTWCSTARTARRLANPCACSRAARSWSPSRPARSAFGRAIAAPLFVKLVMRLLSSGIRRRARSRGIDYSFVFMKADGGQLREITRLIEAGAIRPVVDKVFAFESTNEALAYAEAGHAKGKVVIKIR